MSEVSLSEVIEALDRGSSGGSSSPVVAKRAALPVAAAPVVKAAPVSRPAPVEPAPPPPTENRVREEAAPVAQAARPAPVAAPVPPPPSEPSPAAVSVSTTALWSSVLAEVQRSRPLLVHWVEMGTQLDYKPGVLKVGFPTSEASACESLKRDDKRKFLEGLIANMTGATTRLDLVIDSSLAAPAHPEPALFFDAPPPPPKPAAKEPSAAPAAAEPAKPAADPDFYKDPLINATIEAFKARIISTNAPA